MESNSRRLFLCLLFIAQRVVLVVSGEDDEWIVMKKKDLCPALHKEIMCTTEFVDFGKVAEEIKKLGEKDGNPFPEEQLGAGQDAANCGDPLKKAMCASDTRPLCLEDRSSDDGDAAERRVCNNLYKTCPLLADRDSLNYTKECADYLKRKYSDMTCEYVGGDFDAGACPRPTQKMPAFYIDIYEAKSKAIQPVGDILSTANGWVDNAWDPGCLKTVRELPCMPIFCDNDDETTVRIKNKRKDCSRAMECVSKATKKLESLTGGLATALVDQLRDMVKESCETVIKSFDDLIDPPGARGGSSTVDVSICSIILIVALTGLKIIL